MIDPDTEEKMNAAEERKSFHSILTTERILIALGTLALIVLLWGADQLYEMNASMTEVKDHIKDADEFHKKIPDGFFTQARWGLMDEFKSNQIHNAQMALLDKRQALLEKEIEAHLEEAQYWKEVIKRLAERHSFEKEE